MENTKNMQPQADETPQPAGRKPYVKPACVSEQIFETTALACGKVPGQSPACNSSPSAS
jgi:hypothetical protein